ncbi:integrase [Streptomyces sp. NPDC004376]
MPTVESRGNSIRVKWWNGEYKLDDDGKPTKRKLYDSASGPNPDEKFKDEDEAYNYGLDREYEVRHGKGVRRVDSSTLMSKYVWLWFNSSDLRPNSEKTYGSILRSVIEPYWGERPVGDITPIEYDFWKKQVKKRYSANYASQILGVFRMLMEDAVLKHKMRTESPVIEQRRRGMYAKKQIRRVKRELPIQAVHQVASNFYQVWGYAGWVYTWTIAFTGMRPPGEMYGLQRGFASPYWPASDRDRERREASAQRYQEREQKLDALRVQHQMYYVDSKPTLAGPKYDSYRTLVVPSFLHEMHTALLLSHDKPWVFISKTGKPLLGTQFARDYWHPTRDGSPERAGRRGSERPKLEAVPEMEGQDLYRLRHWHRELLDEPGADIATVAKEARMGHELPGMEGVYSKVTISMEERIVEYLQGVWEKEVVAAGLWVPQFPIALPVDLSGGVFPQFSGLPILGES